MRLMMPWCSGTRKRRGCGLPGCADFEEAETECAQCVYVFAVFIESGSQPDRIGQVDAHEFDGLGSVVENRKQTEFVHFVERVESEMVGFFGIKFKQQAAG